MSLEIVRQIYKFKPARLAIKFTVSLFVIKAISDFHYAIFYGSTVTLPRYNRIVSAQHPLNPPIVYPYPVPSSPERRKNIQRYYKINHDIYSMVVARGFMNEEMYSNHPKREDPNQIDHFLYYSEAHRIMEPIYYRVIEKMSQAGAEIPEGINQKIRELQQYQLRGVGCVSPAL